MKAAKIKPSDASEWTAPLLPVVDGPHRQQWKADGCPNEGMRTRNHGFRAGRQPTDSGERDADANGGLSNAIRALEDQ